MKFRSLMTAICVLATANIVSAAPFAYIANSGTKNVTVIDTATNTKIGTEMALPDDNGATLPNPYAYAVAVGASGQYVYVGLQDTNEVVVLDATTGPFAGPAAVVKRIGLGADSPGGLAVNDAETRLYVASNQSNTLIIIDITGSGASEVGRVTVHDSAVSSPEGVVLSPDGLKAYVANSTQGSVAEIALDEATNIYTRTNLIALGNNLKPIGLAINAAGTKLYASNFNGTASVVNTSTRVATDLTVGSGNVSVAMNNVTNKVYAPSNTLNNIYVIDGAADTVSSTVPSAIAAPKGSSVTPNGNKLFLTMNAATSGETVQIFNTADLSNALATPLATVNLPVGALPNSMGNFIGPEFTYTINATQGASCTVAPLGAALPANKFGKSFTITPTSGACEVFVDAVSVGYPSVYKVVDASLTPTNHTITATNTAGTFYTLSGDWITSVGGCLQSTPAGISCISKSAQFLSGTSVTLGATPGFQVQAGSWTGSCAGSGVTCVLTMDGPKTFGAVIVAAGLGGPVKNETKGTFHETCAAATGAATTGDVIKISTDIASCVTTGTPGVTVTMSSQWNKSDYSAKGTYASLSLTITDVAVIANDLVL